MKTSEIPQFLQPFLWSIDISKLDTQKDKLRIITNILNLGSEKAVKWLFEMYTKEEIQTVVENPKSGEWNKKSINYWALYFNITPHITARNI